jgi:hypothetical protein
MFPKNHSIILMVIQPYFKLNPDKEEKIANMFSHSYPSTRIGLMSLFPKPVEVSFKKVF